MILRRNFLTAMVGSAVGASLVSDLWATPRLDLAPADDLAKRLANDPLRPQYHLLPHANWMNDPNGPIYFNHQYHMFYQYNPHAAIWGDMHWGHAISADMVHWKHLPAALAPTPGGPDADGCFTGTAFLKDDKVFVLYTGVQAATEEQATIKDATPPLRETQCVATSSDPELRTWTKQAVPVIAAPPAGIEVNGFRDPSPWRQGDWWYTVLGSGIANQGGAILLYRSKDLLNWEYMHVLSGRNQNGAPGLAAFDPWEVWECPEFFALGGKHVLIYSTSGKAHWQSGTLDAATMRFQAERAGILDYGAFYAPKTQLDKSGNRILWGWINESRPAEEHKAAGWAGMMSLPRVLSLDGAGQLKQSVATEVNTLREGAHQIRITDDEDENRRQIEDVRLAGCCGEIECAARRTATRFELALKSQDGAATWLKLRFDPARPDPLSIDSRPLPLHLHEGHLEISIHVDGSVIEVIANQQIAWTKRFYSPVSGAHDLRLEFTGKTTDLVTLQVWQLSPVSSDRLTT